MAQPADKLNWASDTNFSSGTESGTPTKVDPGAAYEAQGGVPGAAFVAPYWNWALNNISLWLTYLQNLNTDAAFLAFTFVWTAVHRFTAGVRVSGISLEHTAGTGGELVFTNTSGAATAKTFARQLPLKIVNGDVGAASTGWHISSAGNAYSAGNNADAVVYIDLPTGAAITGYAMGCTPVGSGTMSITLQEEDINTSSGVSTISAIGATQTSSGTAYQQLFQIGLSDVDGEIANTGRRYRIFIGSDTAGHEIQYLSITYTLPGVTPAW